jgi:hypothetical protein
MNIVFGIIIGILLFLSLIEFILLLGFLNKRDPLYFFNEELKEKLTKKVLDNKRRILLGLLVFIIILAGALILIGTLTLL